MNDTILISHFVCSLARSAIESLFETRKSQVPPEINEHPFFQKRQGVFVCLKKKGQLRGCIGTIFPCQPSLHQEIIRNAVSAAREDPRFPPLAEQELSEITLSVDILSEPERVIRHDTLDPKRYGIIVEWQDRRGVLLPDLEGVETIDQQLEITRKKAGIPGNVPYTIYRFTVERYQEEAEREHQ